MQNIKGCLYSLGTICFYMAIGVLWISSCTSSQRESSETGRPGVQMDSIAEDYVKLVLQIGLYNPDYVDAYYGPEEWKPDVPENLPPFPAEELKGEVAELQSQLESMDHEAFNDADKGRFESMRKQLIAVNAAIDMLGGKKISFDEESKLLYDAVAPAHPESFYKNLLTKLDQTLPGIGSVTERLSKFKDAFVIPPHRLDTVFKAAIEEARKRTLRHISLPSNENFKVEFVTNKSWSGYNWYQGNSYSLIQVNTDLPIYIDRAIDLACHEGYPGHHVFNVLIEKYLVRDNGWVEFSVYPLYSPQSLIAEGSANYGIDVAFPGDERITFEKNVLFPLAGLDPDKAEEYYQVQGLAKGLAYAGNEAARKYLDGNMTKEEAIQWLVDYNLMTPDRAAQRIGFIDQYRSYVINYNLGQDIVAQYIEKKGGTADNPEKRWELFESLLSQPHTPGKLIEATRGIN